MGVSVAIEIEPASHDRFPDLAVLSFVARGLTRADAEVLNAGLREQTVSRLKSLDVDRLLEQRAVSVWRDAFKRMGLRASDFRSSIEQLLRRALRSGPPEIGVLVDLYNRASIASLAPIGAYDVAVLDGPISVRPLHALDRFEPLGGDTARFPLHDSVLGYAIGKEVLCWALNCRDAKRTALAASTDVALFVSEAVDREGQDASRNALLSLRNVLSDAGAQCGELSTRVRSVQFEDQSRSAELNV